MSALRKFADMLRPFVHGFKQTPEAFRKSHVTNAATEPARLFEISLGETAHRAFLRRRAFLDLFRRADAEEEIGERKTSRILHAFFLRAGIAEIHLLHFPFEDLRQENCRIIAFANVAQHRCRLDLETPETFNPGHLQHLLRRPAHPSN